MRGLLNLKPCFKIYSNFKFDWFHTKSMVCKATHNSVHWISWTATSPTLYIGFLELPLPHLRRCTILYIGFLISYSFQFLVLPLHHVAAGVHIETLFPFTSKNSMDISLIYRFQPQKIYLNSTFSYLSNPNIEQTERGPIVFL